MREFVYFSRDAVTTGNFKDLMKAGRMDIVLHIVIHSFFVSNARRNDVKLNLFFYGQPDPPKHLELWSEREGKESPVSKKDVAGLIKRVLYKSRKDGKRIEALPSCFVQKQSLPSYVDELAAEGRDIFLLDGRGEDVREAEIGENPVFILGDHKGMPHAEKRRISRVAKKVSLGNTTYFASQAMSILQNELDRRGIF